MTGACRPALTWCREKAHRGATVSSHFRPMGEGRVWDPLAATSPDGMWFIDSPIIGGQRFEGRAGITLSAVLVADRPQHQRLDRVAGRSFRAGGGAWTTPDATRAPFPGPGRSARQRGRQVQPRCSAPSVPASVASPTCSSGSPTSSETSTGWQPAARHLPETSSSPVTVPGQHITRHECASRPVLGPLPPEGVLSEVGHEFPMSGQFGFSHSAPE